MITIRECLAILHSGDVCSVKVVSFDTRRRDRCGRVLEYPECVLVWAPGPGGESLLKGERSPTELEKQLSGGGEVTGRKPNHGFHYTRNLRVLQQGMPTEMIVKIHPALIIEFNGKTTCP